MNVSSQCICHFKARHQVINMSFLCNDCGCRYEWKFFFNNHRRTVHGIPTKREKRTYFSDRYVDFLDSYYTAVCDRPSLDEIRGLAHFLDIKKEAVYFWFVNRRQKEKRLKANSGLRAVSLKQDVDDKRRIDRLSPGTLEGGKRAKEERHWWQCE